MTKNWKAMLARHARAISDLIDDLETAMERDDAEMAVGIVVRLNAAARDADWDVLRWRDEWRKQ